MAALHRVLITLAPLFVAGVIAEKHTISFKNNCGHGKPQLIQAGKVLSNGEDYNHDGIFSAGIAYLQTGECGFNAERCTMLEMTLVNPSCVGCGSSTDISLIPDHALNVPVAFSYYNGCDGQGATCLTPDCKTAFFVPNDTTVQVACQEPDVNLLITFCPDGHGGSPVHSLSTSNAATPASSTSIQATTSSTLSSKTTSSSVLMTSSTGSATSTQSSTLTNFAVASTLTSVVNRKKCKPGQKARRKRDSAAKALAEEHARGEALAHHRRVHGHH